jgi:hypothetical protein
LKRISLNNDIIFTHPTHFTVTGGNYFEQLTVVVSTCINLIYMPFLGFSLQVNAIGKKCGSRLSNLGLACSLEVRVNGGMSLNTVFLIGLVNPFLNSIVLINLDDISNQN